MLDAIGELEAEVPELQLALADALGEGLNVVLALTVPLGLELALALYVTEVLAVALTEDDADEDVEPL